MKRSLELWVCKKALLAHLEATGQPLAALSSMNDEQILQYGEEMLQARMNFELARDVVKRRKLPEGMRADNNCKDCYGEGYKVQVTNEGRKLAMCHCVRREVSPIIVMN